MSWKEIIRSLGWIVMIVAAIATPVVADLVTKPYTFTPFTPAKSGEVNENLDTLYNLVNGNLSDPNISASANISPSKINLVNGITSTMLQDSAVTSAKIADGAIVDVDIASGAAIQQSKISGLASAIAALVAKSGDTMTGQLVLGYASPSIRIANTVNGDGDFKIQSESGTNGVLTFYENTNTYASPTWAARATIPYNGVVTTGTDLTTKSYVDTSVANAGSSLGFSQLVKTDGNFSTASTTFVDVTGLSTSVTNIGLHRLRIYLNTFVDNNTGGSREISVNIQVDDIDINGTDGIWTQTVPGGGTGAVTVMLVTQGPKTAGAHTVKVQLKSSSGSVTMRGNSTSVAVLTVEEMTK